MSTVALLEPVAASERHVLDVIRDFGADNTGKANAVSALNAMWDKLRNTVVNTSVPYLVRIAPGTYNIDLSAGSLDFTDLIAFNTMIDARGAVFMLRGSGKNGFEFLGTRGLTWYGGDVLGDAGDAPLCGILAGNNGTATNGNNYFRDLRVQGHYTTAAFWNIGSETSSYAGCWFVNDRVATNVYGYLGDGVNRFGAASAFATVRSANTAVSYTSNQFSENCRFECVSGGGVPLYIEGAVNWDVDPSCYIVGFGSSAVQLRVDTTSRISNLKLNGLFENAGSPGLDNSIEILIPSGQTSALERCTIDFGNPHGSNAFIKLVDPAGGTPGTVALKNVDILTAGPFAGLGAVPLFDRNGGTLNFTGTIKCNDSTSINLGGLSNYSVDVYTDDVSTIASLGAGYARIIDQYAVVEKHVDALTGAGALSIETLRSTFSNATGGTYAVTLAAPTAHQLGKRKQVTMTSGDATNTVTLALTNIVGGSASTTCTFNSNGDSLLLEAVQTASSTYRWLVLKEYGVVMS